MEPSRTGSPSRPRVPSAPRPRAWSVEPGERGLAERLLLTLNPELERHVLGSGLSDSLRRYSLLALAAAAAASAATGLLGLLYATRSGVGMPWALLGLLLGWAAGFSLSLAVAIQLPRMLYNSRGSMLEPRFPLFAAGLASRLAAGSTLSAAFMDMYERELRDLPEFRIELEYIVSGLRAGLEPSLVLERAAWLTPSTSLRSLLAALAVSAKSGSGLSEVVDALVREYLFNVEGQVDRVVSGLGALLEMFVAASVMLPVALGVVGLLLAFQPLPGLSFNSLAFLVTFIVTPIVAAATIVLADSIVSKVRL